MFENPRRGRQARNFTTNVPKILENCRWVPLMASNAQLRSLETTISSPNMQYKTPVQQYRALFARDYPGVFTRLVSARLQYYPKHCLSSLT